MALHRPSAIQQSQEIDRSILLAAKLCERSDIEGVPNLRMIETVHSAQVSVRLEALYAAAVCALSWLRR